MAGATGDSVFSRILRFAPFVPVATEVLAPRQDCGMAACEWTSAEISAEVTGRSCKTLVQVNSTQAGCAPALLKRVATGDDRHDLR
jgi:hypothetical protein